MSAVETRARAWAVSPRAGAVLGFTDHDRDLSFEGIVFRAGTGMSARALVRGTGLAVDNSEGFGALSDAAISEDDIRAGRLDGAGVRIWEVNWADVGERREVFRGSIGEISRALWRGTGAFRAELRGLAEALSVEGGFVYHRRCSAVLGDGRCRFDLATPGFAEVRAVETAEGGRVLGWAAFAGFEAGWFAEGCVEVLEGAAAGRRAVIRDDRVQGAGRRIELWEALAGLAPGERVRIVAGCDKRAGTCRLKFDNFNNFRGFPHIPGDDWLAVFPTRARGNDGGSMNQ